MNLETNTTKVEAGGEINLNRCERVKARINAYLTLNPRLTLQNVAAKTTVAYSTLRRIVNLNGNPQPEAVIKIYQTLGFDKELYQYMCDCHPEIAGLIEEKNRKRDNQYVEDNTAKYFVSESSYQIMCMAYTTAGISEEDIKLHHGLIGIGKLYELLAEGVLVKRDDGRIVGKNENYRLSYKDTLKAAELSLKYYRLAEAGGGRNHINHQTESLSLEGIEILMALDKEHAKERRDRVFNNPRLHGDRAVFHTSVSSTFMPYDTDPEVLQ